MKRLRWQGWLLWGGLILLAAPLAGARTQNASQRQAVDAGREVFFRNCASCHGETGTGYGPAARVLRRQPSDLTALSNRTQPFDRRSIRDGITGHIRLDSPDGISEMPRWRGSLDGNVLAAGGTLSELDALLTFLETIQRVPSGPYTGISIEDLARAGATLFATHCAACHGPTGRGLPPSGYTLRIAPPDLTMLASRTGGEVNVRSLYESIARRDHEGSEMPSWDRAFQKAGWPAALTAKNIEALARYVESIQQP